MKISSTENVASNALKMLIFGESGAGKTSLAKTLKEPTLIISAEAGLLPLQGHKIDVVDISQNDKGEMIPPEKRLERLTEVYRYLFTEEARSKYKVVFIDSLSEISQCLIAQLNQEFPDRSQSLVMYGENAKKLRSLVKSFRDIPHFSVIFTALSVIDKDENNSRFMTIDLVGGFATKLPAYFDEVFYLSVDKDGNRTLLTQKTDRVVSKDRSNRLNKLEPADLGLIFEKIRINPEPKKKEKENA